MLKDPEILDLMRKLTSKLGRKTMEVTHLDSSEVADGETVDSAVISSIQEDDGVEIKHISYVRYLDCGHIAQANSIVGVCENCGRRVCDACHFTCAKCRQSICRYCGQSLVNNDVEETFCVLCYPDVKARRTAINVSKALFRFFSRK